MRIFLKYNVQWTKYDRIDILLACVSSRESNPPYNHLFMIISILFFSNRSRYACFSFFFGFFPSFFFLNGTFEAERLHSMFINVQCSWPSTKNKKRISRIALLFDKRKAGVNYVLSKLQRDRPCNFTLKMTQEILSLSLFSWLHSYAQFWLSNRFMYTCMGEIKQGNVNILNGRCIKYVYTYPDIEILVKRNPLVWLTMYEYSFVHTRTYRHTLYK